MGSELGLGCQDGCVGVGGVLAIFRGSSGERWGGPTLWQGWCWFFVAGTKSWQGARRQPALTWVVRGGGLRAARPSRRRLVGWCAHHSWGHFGSGNRPRARSLSASCHDRAFGTPALPCRPAGQPGVCGSGDHCRCAALPRHGRLLARGAPLHHAGASCPPRTTTPPCRKAELGTATFCTQAAAPPARAVSMVAAPASRAGSLVPSRPPGPPVPPPPPHPHPHTHPHTQATPPPPAHTRAHTHIHASHRRRWAASRSTSRRARTCGTLSHRFRRRPGSRTLGEACTAQHAHAAHVDCVVCSLAAQHCRPRCARVCGCTSPPPLRVGFRTGCRLAPKAP